MDYLTISIIVLAVSVGFVLLINRNLRQREKSRRLRAVFMTAAEDLISKPELPDRPAKFLATIASLPEGWITRFMLGMLLKEMIVGKSKKPSSKPMVAEVPPQLRVKYVQALLALTLSDSYRCALLGRLWRGANLWVLDAVKEPKPDVDAHATRRVVEQVSHVRTPRHILAAVEPEACLVA